MKSTVFHCNRHYQTPEEHVICGVEIIDSDLSCNGGLELSEKFALLPVDMIPSKGSRTIGIIEVMGRGRASVSQYTAIRRMQ